MLRTSLISKAVWLEGTKTCEASLMKKIQAVKVHLGTFLKKQNNQLYFRLLRDALAV